LNPIAVSDDSSIEQMLILIALPYLTAEMALGRIAAALHPVIAALLFLLSVNLAMQATNAARNLPSRESAKGRIGPEKDGR